MDRTGASPGWGIAIHGDSSDIAEWKEAFREGFDPWIEVLRGQIVVRSGLLENLSSKDDVYARGKALVERLNGAMGVLCGCDPVNVLGTVCITPNGFPHTTMFAEGASFGSSRARAEAVAIGRDGKPIPTSPKPSLAQDWVTVADQDEWLNDALMYFGKSRVRTH